MNADAKINKYLVKSSYYTWYHGTATAYLPFIKQHGLVPGVNRNWELFYYHGNNRDKSVFVTRELSDAATYAKKASENTNSEPIILEISFPEHAENKVITDTKAYANRYIGKIPVTWIRSIWFVKLNKLGHITKKLKRLSGNVTK